MVVGQSCVRLSLRTRRALRERSVYCNIYNYKRIVLISSIGYPLLSASLSALNMHITQNSNDKLKLINDKYVRRAYLKAGRKLVISQTSYMELVNAFKEVRPQLDAGASCAEEKQFLGTLKLFRMPRDVTKSYRPLRKIRQRLRRFYVEKKILEERIKILLQRNQ